MSNARLITDEDQAEKVAQDAKLERERELADICTILSTPSGMRFMKRLLREGRVFTTTFTGNSTGMFLEGQRNLALKFFSDIAEAAPDKLPELIVTLPASGEGVGAKNSP